MQGGTVSVVEPVSGIERQELDFCSVAPPSLVPSASSPLRAVVFVIRTTKKGTSRSGQEYESPLLVLTGAEYTAMPSQVLHDRLCTTLRGDLPGLMMELFGADGTRTLVFEGGATTPGPPITKDDGSDDPE